MQLNANWYELMTGDEMVPRAMEQAQTRTEFQVDFAIWKDMMEEPTKYGDDIYEWLALHEKLINGPGRWRLAAYEYAIQAEEEAQLAAEQAEWRAAFTPIAKQAATLGMKKWCERDVNAFIAKIRNAVVTIQAAVRGHQARSNQPFRDCCMCLSHRVCPLQTDVGMMCRGCAEQGPYDEETGPIADPWSEFRGDYVDLAPEPTDYDSEPEVDPSYIPEPRGVRDRLHEFGVNRLFKCGWEQGNTGTCLWCGTTFKRPYSGMFEGANEFGYCSDECDRNRYCWLRMQWAGKKGPLDHVWLAGLAEGVIRSNPALYEECRHCRCPLDEGQTNRFCDRDCEYAYFKEEWRE